MLKIESDGTIGGTKVAIDGKPQEHIKRIIFDIDPGSKKFPSMKVSLWGTEGEDGDVKIHGTESIQAVVDCHGKKFKLEVGE